MITLESQVDIAWDYAQHRLVTMGVREDVAETLKMRRIDLAKNVPVFICQRVFTTQDGLAGGMYDFLHLGMELNTVIAFDKNAPLPDYRHTYKRRGNKKLWIVLTQECVWRVKNSDLWVPITRTIVPAAIFANDIVCYIYG